MFGVLGIADAIPTTSKPNTPSNQSTPHLIILVMSCPFPIPRHEQTCSGMAQDS